MLYIKNEEICSIIEVDTSNIEQILNEIIDKCFTMKIIPLSNESFWSIQNYIFDDIPLLYRIYNRGYLLKRYESGTRFNNKIFLRLEQHE